MALPARPAVYHRHTVCAKSRQIGVWRTGKNL